MPTLTLDEARRKLVKGEAILSRQRAEGVVDPAVVRAVEALRKAILPEPTSRCCGGSGVCDRAKDPQGRDLAHRIYSPVLGEHVWIARNRADALKVGIVREDGEAVYYLDTDDIELIRQDPAKVTMFKKAFLSPEKQ